MNLKAITVDGIQIEMTDTAVQVVQKALAADAARIAELTTQIAAGKTAADGTNAKVAELTTQLAAKDAEITTLKKQVEDAKVSPDKLDELVKDRQRIVDAARKLLGDKLVTDGKSVEDMRKQVVDAMLGDAAKGWDANQINASFNTLLAAAPATTTNGNTQDRLTFALSHSTSVLDERDKALENAWKKPAA